MVRDDGVCNLLWKLNVVRKLIFVLIELARTPQVERFGELLLYVADSSSWDCNAAEYFIDILNIYDMKKVVTILDLLNDSDYKKHTYAG